MSEPSRNWSCSFCGRPQTVTKEQEFFDQTTLSLSEHKYGVVQLWTWATACANPECREVTVKTALVSGERIYVNGEGFRFNHHDTLEFYNLRPSSEAKPQPSFIPAPLREDYAEACAIRDLSPKASATLARRCLQGMIRDFCKLSRKTLFAEIRALRELLEQEKAPPGVTAETIEAIDHVRSVGNIGAHMEEDINLVIPVDAGEAQALIDLIEVLFEDWYVARNSRAERLARVRQIGDAKAEAKVAGGES